MGGRGGSSGLPNVKISGLLARVAFNSAKKNSNSGGAVQKIKQYEDALSGKNDSFINSIESESAARRALEYYQQRLDNVDKRIVALGSAENLQKNPRLYVEKRNIQNVMEKVSKKEKELRERVNNIDPSKVRNQTTTTYENARRRRKKNFDAWFYGK